MKKKKRFLKDLWRNFWSTYGRKSKGLACMQYLIKYFGISYEEMYLAFLHSKEILDSLPRGLRQNLLQGRCACPFLNLVEYVENVVNRDPDQDLESNQNQNKDFESNHYQNKDFLRNLYQNKDFLSYHYQNKDFLRNLYQNKDFESNLYQNKDFESNLDQDQDFESNQNKDFLSNQNQDQDFESNLDNDLESNNTLSPYAHLWVQCEKCYGPNYKKYFLEKLYMCEYCGYHVKMSSSDRIEFLMDPDTWNPMYENLFSTDPIEFHSEEEPYKDRIDSYQRETGLIEAIQTGIGELDGIPIAIGIMDFRFMGGSMGSVVGEKITRLIEFATKAFLPLMIVCASGGARMQEGSLSLMQMAKISSSLYSFQLIEKLFYISILTSPTTGGVTASFGMLGDVIIAEPNAYIAFAGKRVIEETLHVIVPEGSQESEYLFDKGLFDSIIPRNLLKIILSELFELHDFF